MDEQPNTAEPCGLLKLPTELHLQIMSYLVRKHRTSDDDGFGYRQNQVESPQTMVRSPDDSSSNSFESAQDLARLASTHKRLTPAVQELLYEHVALHPSREAQTNPNSPGPQLELFLRTLIERPDLALRVRSLALWMRKETGIASNIFNSRSWLHCTSAVLSIVERLATPGMDHVNWLVDLQWPTEAMVGSLILAMLPNLVSVELYMKPSPGFQMRYPHQSPMGPFRTPEPERDVRRLGQGLNTMRVTSLTLSDSLWTLLYTQMPSVKTLTLEFNGSHLIEIHDGCYDNLETLVVKHDKRPENWLVYHQSTINLLSSLPSIRVVDMPSAEAAKMAIFPQQVETVVIRNADPDAIARVRNSLRQIIGTSAMHCIEIHWSKGLDICPDWPDYPELAADKGVKVVVVVLDKVWKIFE